ncbi:T7SS effector LXG polymorphic toxin [Listeria goaensis]|uniref:T7SS effector LXG polymorphic toxin n=1 Tax=Listeria goaensis TaxID=1649188 RepID=UPI000B588E22|nr:T7SS effector LXG polymorphic toxin [Listeria goaensis]
MGLIYSSSESSKLIEALSKNLSSGKETITQLKAGSQKVIQAVDGRKLSGAAYTAGKGLFTDLVIPTITRVTTACDSIEQELNKYQLADAVVSSEDYLDEDNLNQQIATQKNMKASVEGTTVIIDMFLRMNKNTALIDVAQNHKRKLSQMSNSLDQEIDELQKKIEKLYEFEGQTKGLFNSSLDDMKLAMQSVLVLNSITIKKDGTYKFPKGADKSWFTELKSKEQLEEMENQEKKVAIKELNELFEKNPATAIEKIKNNDRLFDYVIGALDKFPDSLQDAALGIFIAQESWNKLPKDVATNVLNSPKFASYLGEASFATQAVVYNGLTKLSEKGWSVLAPIGYSTKILSRTSEGAKLIASSKVGLDVFKKLKPVSEFVKAHPVAREGIGYVGDSLTITAYAYEEYINPESPAYGDESKAMYGGLNLFIWNAGPLEGVQYGGPIGAVSGTLNTLSKMGKDWINSIPTAWGDEDGFGWSTSKKNQRKWLDKQYEQYGKHEVITSEKEYRIGVQPQSGSPNFNPNR